MLMMLPLQQQQQRGVTCSAVRSFVFCSFAARMQISLYSPHVKYLYRFSPHPWLPDPLFPLLLLLPLPRWQVHSGTQVLELAVHC